MTNLNNNNVTYRNKVELTTLSDVQEFVRLASACNGQVLLTSGDSFAINAKSLLGVIVAKKLNWDSLTLVSDQDYYDVFKKFIIED